MKKVKIFGFLLILSLGSVATAKDLGRKEIGTLVIGTIFPKTGPQAPYGEEALAGIYLAFEELKHKDPQLASHIKILEADDGSTPNGARQASEDLLRNKRASLLIGSVTNSSSLAIAATADKLKRPAIVPAATGLSLANASAYVFRSCSVDKWQGHLLATFTAKNLGKTKAAILVNPLDSYSYDIAELFTQAFTAGGGQVLVKELYKADTESFAEHLKKIAASSAEVLLFPTASYVEAAKVMAEMKQLNLTLPLLGADRWHTPQLAVKAGAAYAGHFYPVAFASQEDNPQIAHFVEAFKKRLHRYPSALAAMTYDAFLVAVDAFRRAGGVAPNELTRALSRTESLPGLLGPIAMNAEHSAEKAGMIMKTTLQGSRVYGLVHPHPSGKAKG